MTKNLLGDTMLPDRPPDHAVWVLGRQQLHLVKTGIFSEMFKTCWVVPALGGDDQIWLGLINMELAGNFQNLPQPRKRGSLGHFKLDDQEPLGRHHASRQASWSCSLGLGGPCLGRRWPDLVRFNALKREHSGGNGVYDWWSWYHASSGSLLSLDVQRVNKC